MRENKDVLFDSLDQILGLEVQSIKLGHGSFLTIDFGRMIEVRLKTNKGEKISKRGEWHLWVYMCSWRIDKSNSPLIGSNDPRESIEIKLHQMLYIKLINYIILNDSFDIRFIFENDIILSLFNCNTVEDEHWMLFTPEDYVIILGPGNKISYAPS